MNLGAKLTEKRIIGKRRGETNNTFPSFALSSKRPGGKKKNNLVLERKQSSEREVIFLKRFLIVSDSQVSKEKLDLLQFYFKNSL